MTKKSKNPAYAKRLRTGRQKIKKSIQFDIVTALPGLTNSYFIGGMMKKAIDKKIITIKEHNLHDYSSNKYGSVDDKPYGGGAGMILEVEPIVKCLNKIRNSKSVIKKYRTILFSASGKRMTQVDAVRLSKYDQIIFVCGRYEGVDERVKKFVDEELSIGEYVVTGGELPALVVIDAVTRLIPGVLGNKKSAVDESHSVEGVLEFPQYTRPEKFKIQNSKFKTKSKSKILKVPEVLLSGNHKLINQWREDHRKTRLR